MDLLFYLFGYFCFLLSVVLHNTHNAFSFFLSLFSLFFSLLFFSLSSFFHTHTHTHFHSLSFFFYTLQKTNENENVSQHQHRCYSSWKPNPNTPRRRKTASRASSAHCLYLCSRCAKRHLQLFVSVGRITNESILHCV